MIDIETYHWNRKYINLNNQVITNLFESLSYDLPIEQILGFNMFAQEEYGDENPELAEYLIQGIEPIFLNYKGLKKFHDLTNTFEGSESLIIPYFEDALLLEPLQKVFSDMSYHPKAEGLVSKFNDYIRASKYYCLAKKINSCEFYE